MSSCVLQHYLRFFGRQEGQRLAVGSPRYMSWHAMKRLKKGTEVFQIHAEGKDPDFRQEQRFQRACFGGGK